MDIKVTALSETSFQVEVNSISHTSHTVQVTLAYAQKLTKGKVSTARLVEKSFEFLLEREPNTSILRSFELSVIGRYFPEYERKIQDYF